jgi:ABC-2 type transport system ATP-binding protein
MMMDIIKPDSGEVYISAKNFMRKPRIKSVISPKKEVCTETNVVDTIRYMASLKGITVSDARIDEMLKHVGMLPHKNKKIEEMSRGMGQLIQFLVTIVHDPSLVILDEPFSVSTR